MNCQIEDLDIEGLKLITPFSVSDNRGGFAKLFEQESFKSAMLKTNISEMFISSSKKGVIRGLHFQLYEPQVKYVSVLQGDVWDYAVDLRLNSASFGRWERVRLTSDNHKVFYIPEGFAHGFEVCSDEAIVAYMCVGKYIKEYDTGVRYDDTKIGIQWETKNPIISERDESLMTLDEYIEKCNGN
jgi:dTDP-4-dehydrorhamnose 3,5-epimerase